MNEQYYPFTLSRTEYRYEFISVSAEREVKKVVLLSQTERKNIYNLALLDLCEDGELSDISETNNSDMRTVMATTIRIIGDFLNQNRDCYVLFRGSDPRRHRLYRIILGREAVDISRQFLVLGINDETPSIFEANTDYEFYLIGNHENNKN